MNWLLVASAVKTSTVCRLLDGPLRRMIEIGVEVSFVEKMMACGSPSVTYISY